MGLVTSENDSKKSQILKKHAATIHCSNSLSLLQRKISNAFLYHAYHELLVKDEHAITVRELCNIIGYSGNNHSVIKDAIKGLIATVIEWNVLDENTGEEEWNASSILASVQIKGALCRYAYSPCLKRLLHTPSVYGKINMIVQSRFKSAYGLALYENCVRYYGLPFTKWFEMETFRKLMGLDDNVYIIFRDLKRRVLDKAVDEVNTFSDLLVKHELRRVGRRVTQMRFSLKDRPKKIHLGLAVKPEPQESFGQIDHQQNDMVKELLEKWGVNMQVIQEWLIQFGPQKIKEKMEYVQSTRAYQNQTIKKLAGYLRVSLEQDYEVQQEEPNVNISLRNKVLERQNQKKYEAKYKKYVIEFIVDKYNKLHNQQKLVIEENFVKKYLVEPAGMIIVDSYQKHGLKSVEEEFVRFLLANHPEFNSQLISLTEFVAQQQ